MIDGRFVKQTISDDDWTKVINMPGKWELATQTQPTLTSDGGVKAAGLQRPSGNCVARAIANSLLEGSDHTSEYAGKVYMAVATEIGRRNHAMYKSELDEAKKAAAYWEGKARDWKASFVHYAEYDGYKKVAKAAKNWNDHIRKIETIKPDHTGAEDGSPLHVWRPFLKALGYKSFVQRGEKLSVVEAAALLDNAVVAIPGHAFALIAGFVVDSGPAGAIRRSNCFYTTSKNYGKHRKLRTIMTPTPATRGKLDELVAAWEATQ